MRWRRATWSCWPAAGPASPGPSTTCTRTHVSRMAHDGAVPCRPYVRRQRGRSLAFRYRRSLIPMLSEIVLVFIYHQRHSDTNIISELKYRNNKHLRNVGPIRHCEPPHAHSPGVATVARAHRCPRRRQRQRQRVTEGTAMAPLNGPNHWLSQCVFTRCDSRRN